ncbi:MAG: heme exporter protein CcmB [Anaerolineae bacterium]|nr:heme exporter protein CcmB [Anaerolineae bacterium]MCA9888839.1 heme exporter protein CcmB [Anaerolineae bacterium]MCA9896125.1 heme exporter protein CcmB [Anaerolineae bacterium]MCB9458966.1 heme exporter protein CcmB [Anaerolineaceae bacterium]
MKTGFWQVTFAVLRKDMLAEMRSRELLSVMGLFALLSVIIFSFALELDREARETAISGVIWVTVAFASIIGLNRSMNSEREQGNFDALLLAPVDRSALFLGKFLGNFLVVLLVGLVLLPLGTLLYNITLIQPWVLLILVLGIFGLSSIGTLLAAMTAQTRARDALLSIAMLPIVLPVLLAAVRATTSIISNEPIENWITWPQILLVVDLIYLVLCFFTFGFVIEE